MNDDKVDQELDALLKADDKQAESFGTQVLRLIYKLSGDCEEGCDMCPHIAEVRVTEEINKLHATALAAARREGAEGERERCAALADIMAVGETYETGRQKAINIAAMIRAAAKEGE